MYIPASPYAYVTIYETIKRVGDIHSTTLLISLENIVLFLLIAWCKKRLLRRYPEWDPSFMMKRTLVQSIPSALIVRSSFRALQPTTRVESTTVLVVALDLRFTVVSTPLFVVVQVVVVNLLLVPLFNLKAKGVAVIGSIPAGLPSPFELFEDIDSDWWNDIQLLILPALVMSLVGFLEAISIAKAMGMKYARVCLVVCARVCVMCVCACTTRVWSGFFHLCCVLCLVARPPGGRYRSEVALSSNQELYGHGLANIVASFFRGVPVAGGFPRTVVNGSAGATTPLSSGIAGFLLLMVVLFITSVFENLPLATLAATIVVSVAKLLDFRTGLLLWKVSRPDALVFVVAFVATLLLGIEEGVIVACVLSVAIVIRQTTSPHWAVLGRLVRSFVVFIILVMDDGLARLLCARRGRVVA